MFIRCAFFKGIIIPGNEEAFHAYWQKNLVPLWSSFPNLLELRVLREVESDDFDNLFPLVMSMRFSTREDIKIALESPARWKSKETSKRLFKMFNGVVIHTVFESHQFIPNS